MDDFMMNLIGSAIVTAFTYGFGPVTVSVFWGRPIQKKKFKVFCIIYTIVVWFAWQMYRESSGNGVSIMPAILWGYVSYLIAIGIMGKKYGEPGKRKGEKYKEFSKPKQQDALPEEERKYQFALQVSEMPLYSRDLKGIAKMMGKTPTEARDYYTDMVRAYNQRRYSPNQEHAVSDSVEPETPIEEPAKEPEIQRWYTCPKCGQLVKDGEECDCEAVKLALEEERKKKEEQKRQKRQALKKALRLFVKRNFSRDGKNQAGKPSWTVKSRFRGQAV